MYEIVDFSAWERTILGTFPFSIMSKETLNQKSDTPLVKIRSMGCVEGQPLDLKGVFGKVGTLLAETHHNKKGAIDETFDDPEFMRDINLDVLQGAKTVHLDFEQEPDFPDSTADRVAKLGKYLWTEKGQVSLKITGLTEARVTELRNMGFEKNGITLYSLEHTKDAFVKPKEKEEAVAPQNEAMPV